MGKLEMLSHGKETHWRTMAAPKNFLTKLDLLSIPPE